PPQDGALGPAAAVPAAGGKVDAAGVAAVLRLVGAGVPGGRGGRLPRRGREIAVGTVGGSARALGQTLVRRGGALVPRQHPLQAFPAFLFFAVHGASALLSVRVFRSCRGIFQELSGELSAASRAGHSNASAG